MDVNRLRFGEMIAAGAAAILFLVMFLPWYSTPETTVPRFGGGVTTFGGVNFSAWQSFSWLDLLMLLTIIVALGLALLTMTQRTVALPLSASVIVTGLGALCALLILYRIINQPGENEFVDVQFGAFLGFLAAAAIAFGGYMSMRDEGASFGSPASRIQAQMQVRPAPPPQGAAPGGQPAPGPQQPPAPGAGGGVSSGDPLASPPSPPAGGGETRVSPTPPGQPQPPPGGPPPGSSS